jgi:hypothetical protein
MSRFNAIDTTHRLEGIGFTRQQAEGLAQLLDDVWGQVVTRGILREELDRTTRDIEQRLTIRMGRMLGATAGIVVAAVGVFVGASTLVIHFWR